MARNVPAYETQRFSFGPGILYMGAIGTTPLVDIGAVKGDVEVVIERVPLQLKQGSPQSLVKQYAVEENISIKITGVEWDFDNFTYALGAGVTSISGADEVFEFGGDTDVNQRALRFVHLTGDGGTIDMHFFTTEGSGNLAMALKETDWHDFPYEFSVLEGTTDFEGAALVANRKKIKIIRTPV